MITGMRVHLRNVLLSDAPIILAWENDPAFWPLTAFPGPYTLHEIESDIREYKSLSSHGQQRLIIGLNEGKRAVGAIDFFPSSLGVHAVGLGILIGAAADRRKGYATEALALGLQLARETWQKTIAECLIDPSNLASIRLFESHGFRLEGTEPFKDRLTGRYRIMLTAP